MEFLLTIYLSIWFLVGSGILLAWSTHYEWEIFSLIILALFIGSTYLIFQLSISTIIISALLYIPIGIGWSMYRWKRYCSYVLTDLKKNGTQYKYNSKTLDPTENISKIVHWIFVWPFSALDNLVGDVIDSVYKFIEVKVIHVYKNISSKYTEEFKKELEKN